MMHSIEEIEKKIDSIETYLSKNVGTVITSRHIEQVKAIGQELKAEFRQAKNSSSQSSLIFV